MICQRIQFRSIFIFYSFIECSSTRVKSAFDFPSRFPPFFSLMNPHPCVVDFITLLIAPRINIAFTLFSPTSGKQVGIPLHFFWNPKRNLFNFSLFQRFTYFLTYVLCDCDRDPCNDDYITFASTHAITIAHAITAHTQTLSLFTISPTSSHSRLTLKSPLSHFLPLCPSPLTYLSLSWIHHHLNPSMYIYSRNGYHSDYSIATFTHPYRI